MKGKINLSIDKPCTERLHQSKPTTIEGFCHACEKVVMDFTKMSDAEIIDYFKNNTGNTCGSFHKSQLKVYTEPASISRKRNFSLLGAGLMSFSLLSLLPVKSQAQQAKITNGTHVTQTNTSKEKEAKSRSDEFVVEGVLLDESGFPLPGAMVIVKGTTFGTSTDIDGKFVLRNRKAGEILIFAYIGYENQEILLTQTTTDKLNLKVELKVDSCILEGEVAVNQIYTSKRSLWQRIKALFR